MLKLYKDLLSLYWAGIAVLIALVMYLVWHHSDALLLILLGGWVLVFAWCYFLAFIGSRRLGAVLGLLNGCHVQEAARQYVRLLPRAKGSTLTLIRLNLSACYLEAGEPRKALETLEAMPPLPETKRWALPRMCREVNLAGGLRMLDRLDEADAALERAAASMAQVPEKLLARNDFRYAYGAQVTVQKMTRGDFEGAVPFYTKKLAEAAPLRKQVAAHYDLAWALTHEGRLDEAREHLRFAAENGGDTWYAAAARKKLETM